MRRLLILTLLLLLPSLCFAGLQDDLNALSASGGGVYHLKAKTYYLYRTLTIPRNVSLVGEGYEGAFSELSTWHGTVLKADVSNIKALVETEPGWSGTIANLTIHGNWRANTSLKLVAPQGATLYRLAIAHSNTWGIFLTSTDDRQAVRNHFEQVNVSDTYLALDMMGQPDEPNTLNTFIDCRFAGKFESVRIEQWSDTNAFAYCRIEVPEGGYGIAIEDQPQIGNNLFFFCPIEGYGVGVIALSDGEYCDEYPNRILYTLWGGILKERVSQWGSSCLEVK